MVAAEETTAGRQRRWVHRFQDQMLEGVDQGLFGDGVVAPEDEDEMLALLGEGADGGIGELLPAVARVRGGLSGTPNPVGYRRSHSFTATYPTPLSLEDYLLIPFIIKNRDKVEVSAQTDISHHNTVLKYTKQIGDTYYYVEEIRKRNKSLAFKSLIKREKENPSKERG